MAAYCSFCGGECPHGDKPKECSAKATVFCRNLRDKHERSPPVDQCK